MWVTGNWLLTRFKFTQYDLLAIRVARTFETRPRGALIEYFIPAGVTADDAKLLAKAAHFDLQARGLPSEFTLAAVDNDRDTD